MSLSRARTITVCALALVAWMLAAPTSSQAAVVTLSGNIGTSTQHGYWWGGCNGITQNVRVTVNGGASQSTTCAMNSGAYSVSINLAAAGDIVTVWLDTNGGAQGSLTLKVADAVSNIPSGSFTASHATLRDLGGGTITNAQLVGTDSSLDSDIPFTISGGNFSTPSNHGLHVAYGTFQPGGTVTTACADIDGTFNPAAHTVTLTSSCGLTPHYSSGFVAGSLARFVYTATSSVDVGISSTNGILGWIDISPITYTSTANARMWATTNVVNDVTVGDGIQALVVTWEDMTIGGNLLVNANATIQDFLPVNGVTIVGGTMTGAGAVQLNAGTIRMRGSSTTTQLGPTAGTTPWELYDVELENSAAGTTRSVTIPAAGGGLRINHTFSIGRASDTQQTWLNHQSTHAFLDFTWNVVITSRGRWIASSSRLVTLAGDLTNQGTFTPNASTIELVDATRTSSLLGATTFYNLLIDDTGKAVRFPDSTWTTITNNLTVNGGSCATLAGISSTTPGTVALINSSGTTNVQYADLMDTVGWSAMNATNSFDGGNNTNWTITGSCPTNTYSGTVTSNEGGTVWASCDNVTLHVMVAWSGHGIRRTSCAPGTGAWSVTLPAGPDQTVIAYLNPSTTGERAVMSLRTPSPISNHNGITLTVDRFRVRGAGPSPLTNTMHAQWDAEESTIGVNQGVPITTDRTWEANIESGGTAGWSWDAVMTGVGRRLLVEAGGVFRPDGDLNVERTLVSGTLTSDNRYERHTMQDIVGTGTVTHGDTQLYLTPTGGVSPFGPSGPNNWSIDHIYMAPSGATNMTIEAPGTATTTVKFLQTFGATTWLMHPDHPFISLQTNLAWGVINPAHGTSLNNLYVEWGTVNGGASNWSASVIDNRGGTVNAGSGVVTWTNASRARDGGVTNLNSAIIQGYSMEADCGGTINGGTSRTQLSNGFSRAQAGPSCTAGTFNADTSTIEFTGASAASINADNTTFYNLRIAAPSKSVSIQANTTITVSGTTGTYPGFTTNGGACTSMVRLQSTTTVANATVNLTGSVNMTHTRLQYMTRTGNAATSTNSTNAGGNVGFTITNCTTNLSGFARASDGGPAWSQCNGVTQNVSVSINGAAPISTSCAAGTGAFSRSFVYGDDSDVIVVYLNPSSAGDRGATYFRATVALSGIEVTLNHVRVRGSAHYTRATFDVFDQDQDPDIPIRTNGTDVTSQGATELLVESGTQYDLDGTMTIASLDVRGEIYYNGWVGPDGELTLTGSGTGPCSGGPNVQMPLCMADTETFNLGEGKRIAYVITFTGTSDTVIPSGGALRYYSLRIAPTSGNPTYTIGTPSSPVFDVALDLTIGSGTSPVTVQTVVGSPLLTRIGIDCTYYIACTEAAHLEVMSGATFRNTSALANLEAWGNVYGAGTIDFQAGTVTRHDYTGEDPLATDFGPTGNADWTFHTLNFTKCESVNNVITMPGGGTGRIRVTSLLNIQAPMRIDAATNNRGFDIDGDLDIDSGAALDAPPSAPFTLAGNATIDGTFAAGTGTVSIDGGATTSTLSYPANQTFYNLRIASADKTVEFDPDQETIVTGTTGTYPGFTVDGGNCDDRVTLKSAINGNNAPLRVTGPSSITRANLRDMHALIALTATDTYNLGGNTGFTIGNGICAATTISIPTGSSEELNPDILLANIDSVAESTVQITTDSYLGYRLFATDESDTWNMSTGTYNLPDFATKEPSLPATWAGGVSGPSGRGAITVLAANGGRLAKWGPGTTTATDFVNNRYLGLNQNTTTTLHTTTGPTALDTINIAYRAIASTTTTSGAYTGRITYTAIGINP